jgi:hypothetical protein
MTFYSHLHWLHSQCATVVPTSRPDQLHQDRSQMKQHLKCQINKTKCHSQRDFCQKPNGTGHIQACS